MKLIKSTKTCHGSNILLVFVGFCLGRWFCSISFPFRGSVAVRLGFKSSELDRCLSSCPVEQEVQLSLRQWLNVKVPMFGQTSTAWWDFSPVWTLFTLILLRFCFLQNHNDHFVVLHKKKLMKDCEHSYEEKQPESEPAWVQPCRGWDQLKCDSRL